MTAIAAYPVKSEYHSLAVARINEHVSMNFLGSSFLSQHTVAHMHVAIVRCRFLGQRYSLGIFIRLHGSGRYTVMQVPICFVPNSHMSGNLQKYGDNDFLCLSFAQSDVARIMTLSLCPSYFLPLRLCADPE